MSEIEQANGIEIPAEVLEAVAKALFDGRYVPWQSEQKADIRKDCREDAEAAIRAALDAWGVTEQRQSNWMKMGFGSPQQEARYVTPWREVP